MELARGRLVVDVAVIVEVSSLVGIVIVGSGVAVCSITTIGGCVGWIVSWMAGAGVGMLLDATATGVSRPVLSLPLITPAGLTPRAASACAALLLISATRAWICCTVSRTLCESAPWSTAILSSVILPAKQVLYICSVTCVRSSPSGRLCLILSEAVTLRKKLSRAGPACASSCISCRVRRS